MTRPAAVFLLAVGALASLSSYGFFINDEAELAAAAYNLYRGRLTVDVVPLEYYELPTFAWTPRVYLWLDGHGYISESRATAVVGYPFHLAMSLLAPVEAGAAVIILVGTVGVFGGAGLLLLPRWRALSPRGQRRAIVAFGSALTAYVAVNVALMPRWSHDPWASPFAAQIGLVVLVAGGVTAFHALVRHHAPDPRLAHLSALVLVVSPLAFWAGSMKYHGAEVALLCIVAFLRFATPRPPLARWAGAYVVAGVAMWFHAKAGGITVLALLMTDALAFVRPSTRPARPALAALVLPLALLGGLAPYAIENLLLYGTPLAPGYIAGAALGAQDAATANTVAATGVLEAVLRGTALADPRALPGALFHVLVLSSSIEGGAQPAFAVLTVAPILVLAPAELLRRFRRRDAGILDAFFFIHVGGVFLAYGLSALSGVGYDPRYLLVAYPALVFYASAAAWRAFAEVPARGAFMVAGPAVALAVVVLGLTFMALGEQDYVPYGRVVMAFGTTTLVLVVATAASAAIPTSGALRDVVRLARGTSFAAALGCSALFVAFACVLFPRIAYAGPGGEGIVMLIPLSDLARDAVRVFLTYDIFDPRMGLRG